nr:unnamed protein product [Callosobruchus analis]
MEKVETDRRSGGREDERIEELQNVLCYDRVSVTLNIVFFNSRDVSSNLYMQTTAVFCFHCEKPFSTQSSLNRHQREVHNLKCSILTYDLANSGYKNFICSEDNCNSAFKNSQNLYMIYMILKRLPFRK